MCVIFLASKVRPTQEMVERAWNSNKDGAGIAWRAKDADGEPEIAFEKGIMDLKRAKELCEKVPLPYVVHFRVASVGGVREELTHPFVVDGEATLQMKGRTKNPLLFHNGHWSQWNDRVLDAAIHSNNRVPEGEHWSDSRAMAWLVHLYGPGLMELLTQQKGVIMTPDNFRIFLGPGWEKINEIWCSNDYFWRGRSHSSTSSFRGSTAGFSAYCSHGKCTRPPQVGKKVCFTCEQEIATAAAKEGNNASSVGQSQAATTALSIVSGGKKTGPFGKVFTMAEVETFHKHKLISKSALKKYRKAHGARNEKGNRGARALVQMEKLSEAIADHLMMNTGSRN